jgi:GDPmannose 4,6-dehydratase
VAKIKLGKLDALELGNLDAKRDGVREGVRRGMYRMLRPPAGHLVAATNRTETVRDL